MKYAYLLMFVAGVVAACLGIVALYVHAGPLVSAQDNTVGEMLLDEGLRYEANGAVAEALERYHLAEHSRFQGAKNEAHLHLRLAGLCNDPMQRLKHYELATRDASLLIKDPVLWREAWEGQCTLLAEQASWTKLNDALQQWEAQQKSAGNESARVSAARDYYRGWAAEEAGDLEGAEALFRRACVDGFGAPRARLAELLHVKGGNTEVVARLRAEAEVMGVPQPQPQ